MTSGTTGWTRESLSSSCDSNMGGEALRTSDRRVFTPPNVPHLRSGMKSILRVP
jgi:hypothetical protein